MMDIMFLFCAVFTKKEEIAEILEEDIETIRPICEVARAYAPDYEIEKIWSAYCKQSS